MIFPDWVTAPEVKESPLPLFREWAVDIERGEPYTIEGDEALKIWVRLALDAGCGRWEYSANSGDYDNELAALPVCPYITGAEGFSFSHEGGHVTVRITVKTVYNSFETEAETV